MALTFCGTDRRWLVHALSRSAKGFFIKWCDRVHEIIYSRQSFVYSLVTECRGYSVCFLLSCRYVIALLTPVGAIPTMRYTFSTEVGLRHPVMERHASFRAGFNLAYLC